VVIPVRNEATHLPQLLQTLRRHASRIILIDDGSSDRTLDLISSDEFEIIRNPTRQGKTSCIRSALPLAVRSDWILFMDGDGQHDPDDLPRFWNSRNGSDAVLGERDLHRASMPRTRRATNRLMTRILHLLVGGKIQDTQCGYRLVRSAWLSGWLPVGKEFEWESELYMRLIQTRARLKSVPIAVIYRTERSKIFWPRETWRFLKLCSTIRKF